MGQQQLLLLVLAAVIVGISVVVGFNMFSSSAVQSNQDAIVQHVMTIGAKAQEWYRKPAAMGGGGQSFTGLTLAALNVSPSNVDADTLFIAPTATDVTVTAVGKEDGDGDGTNITVQAVFDKDGVKTNLAVTNK